MPKSARNENINQIDAFVAVKAALDAVEQRTDG
jgi:hypothetical protein